MKKLNRKVTSITNLLLVAIFVAVSAFMFIPENILPISGENSISAIYNGDRQKRRVSLMFNVYENTGIVNDIIDVLNENGAKATFFVGGCWADDNQKTLIRIVGEGHEIANHGYFHKDHKKLTEEQNEQEISLTGQVVEALCGVKPTLFAPPSGSFSDLTLEAASRLGYKVIMWSKDTIDWRDSDKTLVFKRATNGIENGDLVLMHPKKVTLEALPDIITNYKSLGFELVTVSENIS